jgi:hypothetical protein
MENQDLRLSPVWEKAKALSVIVATAVIPIAIALGSNWYGQLQKDKEIQLKYIELSIQILSAPSSPSNQAVRKWAVDTINRYSEVKIDSQAENELLKEQLRRIVEKYNETASGVIQQIGK